MLKITEMGPAERALTLRLEGRLVGPWIEELRRLCESRLRRGQALRLNLAEVAFVERAGLSLLLSLQSEGVALVECSAFVEEALKEAKEESTLNTNTGDDRAQAALPIQLNPSG